MILLNNTKTTIKFYAAFVLLLLIIIVGGYYYLTKTKTYESSLNINNIEEIDTIYARYVYGDFYFRVIDYDQDQSLIKSFINDKIYHFFDNGTVFVNGYFSELTPVKLALGYDFSTSKDGEFVLRNFDLYGEDDFVTEVGEVSNDSNIYIDQIRLFKETFSKILATQDQTYFKQAYEDSKKMIRSLYNDENISINIKPINKSKFYEFVDSKINNLNINYFKLRYFKLNQTLEEKTWAPNIAKWVYGDSEITLEYRRKEANVLLQNLKELLASSNNEIIINTIGINESNITPMYLKIDKKNNTISSYYMSKDGYLYVLKMKSDSKKTLITTMHDYLKIAMGIYFNDKPTDKWFIQKQTDVKNYYDRIKDENLVSDLPGVGNDWKKILQDFKSKYGDYPNEAMYEKMSDEREERSMHNKVKNYIYKIMD